LACPLCRQRKGRRACPAKAASICPHCCGTKRRVEIDCPEDCVYLSGAHAPAWEGRETERRRDARRLAPFAQGLSEPQMRLLFLALAGLSAVRARRPDLTDALLGTAVEALRKSAETRSRGILYEHPPEDLRAVGLVDELKHLFEAKDEAGSAIAPDDRDLQPVLAALEGALRETAREDGGPCAFLDTAARVTGTQGRPAGERSTRLIVEP
jgi:hypothetical protein